MDHAYFAPQVKSLFLNINAKCSIMFTYYMSTRLHAVPPNTSVVMKGYLLENFYAIHSFLAAGKQVSNTDFCSSGYGRAALFSFQ